MAPLAFSLALAVLTPLPAAGDQGPGSGQAQVNALTAKISSEAARIRQLTEHLDEARMQTASTAAKLADATRRHDATVEALSANRVVLHDQAVRAYMRGGLMLGVSATPGSGDVTLGRVYLKVASGNLSDAGDRLRQLAADLRRDQAALRAAQQASSQAGAQLDQLRSNAIAIAVQAQTQLDRLQVQLTAAAQAQAQAEAQAAAAGTVQVTAAKTPAPTQGSPVNNGLVALVQQAAAQPAKPRPPTATPAPSAPTPSAPTPSAPTSAAPAPTAATSSGGGAGGVWLQLRQCESGNDYTSNTGNGYYGAYQFSQSTWSGLGYPGRPDQASPAMQDKAAAELQARSGWGQWPACSAALGLR